MPRNMLKSWSLVKVSPSAGLNLKSEFKWNDALKPMFVGWIWALHHHCLWWRVSGKSDVPYSCRVWAALPRTLVNLEAVHVRSTSADLHLERGSDDPVESYTIRYQRRQLPREPHSEIEDIVSTEYSLTDLVLYSTYEVDVVAVNNIGPSLPASIVVTTNEDG